MQPVPDENHSSSGEEVEEDAPHGGNLTVGEEEEDEEDALVNNSLEQLDHIRFEDGQLVDGYNFRCKSLQLIISGDIMDCFGFKVTILDNRKSL